MVDSYINIASHGFGDVTDSSLFVYTKSGELGQSEDGDGIKTR